MYTMTTRADAELVRACRAGDPQAFETLVHKYERPIYNLALRMLKDRDDAMDITQTAFVKAYEKLASFDDRHGFFSWIYRIAINESINFSKRLKRRDEYESGVTATLAPTQESDRRAGALSAEIEQAIEKLKVDYRMVIVLKHFQDFSYDEIAQVLHIPEKTVKSRLFTARQQLKEILDARGIKR